MNDDRPHQLIEEKKFYDRFWALHSNPDLVQVYREFGYEVFRRSSVLEGFERFIKDSGFSGDCCIEIGTCSGLTAVVLSRYFREVVSIDIVPDPIRQRIVEHLQITSIDFVTVKNNADKASVIRHVQFDAAYLDGDHARDTNTDFELVKACGKVLFHEYWKAQPPVWDLVNELSKTGNVKTSGKLALWTN